MMGFLSFILISFALHANPPAAPLDVDKICAEARKQDKANKNNPQYAQSEIGSMCAEIEASNKSGRLSKKMANMKIPIVSMCTMAAGICASGKADTSGTLQKLGKNMAGLCGGMENASGVIESAMEYKLSQTLNKEAKSFDYVTAAQSAYKMKGSVTDMAGAFESGTINKNDAAPGEDPDPKGNKAANCGSIGETALIQSAEMATHLQTANQFKESEAKRKLELATLAKMGGTVEREYYQAEDEDSSYKPDEEVADDDFPHYPPELENAFEELTGMDMDDIMNYDGNPQDLASSILSNLGANPADIASAMSMAGAGGEGGAGSAGKGGALADGSSSSSSKMTATNDTLEIPSMDDLLKKLGGANREPADVKSSTVKAKDIAKMTPSEFEKDTKHNIFERVSLRYSRQISQIEKLPWVSKLNTLANPKPNEALSTRYPASRL